MAPLVEPSVALGPRDRTRRRRVADAVLGRRPAVVTATVAPAPVASEASPALTWEPPAGGGLPGGAPGLLAGGEGAGVASWAPAAPAAGLGGADEQPAPVLGICCSGGGIRSAAYNLGALQVLQETSELGRARYLSAVSGGSYIASAFTVLDARTDDSLLAEVPPFAPGSPEEVHLRNNSTYLAPGLPGKLAIIGRVLVGLSVNLVFIGSLLYVLARPLGWAYGRWFPTLHSHGRCGAGGPSGCGTAIEIHIVHGVRAGLGVMAVAGVLLAVIDAVVGPRRDDVSQALMAWSRRLLVLAAAGAAVLVAIPMALQVLRDVLAHTRVATELRPQATAAGRGSGVSTATAGGGIAVLAGALISELRRTTTLVTDVDTKLRRLGGRARRIVIDLAVTVIGPLTVVAVVLVWANDAATRGAGMSELRGWLVVAALLTALFVFGDLTAWSMHPFYRRRLATVFAVRRQSPTEAAPVDPEQLELSELRSPRRWPDLLVCAAVNVSDEGLLPPGQGCATFVFSAEKIETSERLMPPVDTARYEKAAGRRRYDLTMPAAVAMSGAAISPVMGRMTRRPLRFLMALANVRLGVWLPNPLCLDDEAEPRWYHRPRPSYLLKEALGRTSIRDRFLYVTDGGHYENLGLVELVRRGCTEIYCFDASGDHVDTFSTIGEAIALARVECGVEIELDPTPMRPPAGTALCPQTHVVGRILRPGQEPGRIVFVKAGVTASDPWDVRAYQESDPRFPTHSTADQLYTDDRFEAYRALGRAAARRAVAAMRPEGAGDDLTMAAARLAVSGALGGILATSDTQGESAAPLP